RLPHGVVWHVLRASARGRGRSERAVLPHRRAGARRLRAALPGAREERRRRPALHRRRARPALTGHRVAVALSPFVPGLADAVGAALRELLGIPPQVAFGWHEQRRDPWRMEVTVGDVALQLHAPGSEPALFAGERLAVADRGAADPALLRAVVRRLRHAEREGTPIDVLQAALEAWRPFVGMQDTDFRNVSNTEAIVRIGFRC